MRLDVALEHPHAGRGYPPRTEARLTSLTQ
jgi:hypothetical protein